MRYERPSIVRREPLGALLAPVKSDPRQNPPPDVV
jgi:hypothetical protein